MVGPEMQIKVEQKEATKEMTLEDKKNIDTINGFLKSREDDKSLKAGFDAFKSWGKEKQFYDAYQTEAGKSLTDFEKKDLGKVLTAY